MDDFKSMLFFGEDGEHEVANYLMEKYKISVLPLYQFNNEKAPLLFCESLNMILPDLTCFKAGKVYFVEVKTKNQWVFFRERRETGLDKRLFDEYKKVKDTTGIKINIVFNHKIKDPIGFFMAEIDSFTRFWDGKHKEIIKYKPMIFYDYKILKKI